jgi:formate transporter
MSFRDPKAITKAGIETGETKARLSVDKILVASFLAGAYIAFGGLLAVTVSAGMDPEIWGTLPTFFTGAVFALGLILVVIAGSELLTGNMALVPLAAMKGRVKLVTLLRNLGWVTLGNLIGSLFVAYFLAVQTGVITAELPLARLEEIALKKGVEETEWQIFLRAVGCNWLVCLAVWMALAAEDVAGKVLAIFFPIMGFVAMGFDHVVANMFFLPAAMFAGVDGMTWGDVLHNWLFAGIGNLVGAAVFVAGAYWYLYARDEEAGEKGAGDTPRTGRFSRVELDSPAAGEAAERQIAVVGEPDGKAGRSADSD